MLLLIKSCFLYICLVSLLSGALKMLSFPFFLANTASLLNFRVSDKYLKPTLLLFIAIEFAIPLWIFVNSNIQIIGVAVLILVYTGATAMLLPSLFSKAPSIKQCGCYGSFFQEPVGVKKVFNNAGYLALLFLVLWLGDQTVYFPEVLISLLLISLHLLLLFQKNKKTIAW